MSDNSGPEEESEERWRNNNSFDPEEHAQPLDRHQRQCVLGKPVKEDAQELR